MKILKTCFIVAVGLLWSCEKEAFENSNGSTLEPSEMEIPISGKEFEDPFKLENNDKTTINYKLSVRLNVVYYKLLL